MDGNIGLTKERAEVSWSKLGLSIITILILLTLSVIFLNRYVQKNSDKDRLETIDIGSTRELLCREWPVSKIIGTTCAKVSK
jgi:hypothetical protein